MICQSSPASSSTRLEIYIFFHFSDQNLKVESFIYLLFSFCLNPMHIWIWALIIIIIIFCFLRAFVEKNYKKLKTLNPKLPILIRECSGVEPQLWARYGISLSYLLISISFYSNFSPCTLHSLSILSFTWISTSVS